MVAHFRWIERNNRIFEKSHKSITDVWDRIKCRVALWLSGHNSFTSPHVSDLVRY